jgi:hypothetical protein
MLSIKKWSLQIVECPIVEMPFYFSGGAIEADNKGNRSHQSSQYHSFDRPDGLSLFIIPPDDKHGIAFA